MDMNSVIMTDSPIRFPGLFGDWTFTASSKAVSYTHLDVYKRQPWR